MVMTVGPRVFVVNGEIMTKHQYRQYQRRVEEASKMSSMPATWKSQEEFDFFYRRTHGLEKGNVIPHAAEPGKETYDLTYRAPFAEPTSRLPWDFSQ